MITQQLKNKAQSTIEFSLALILALLFLFLSANLFVWFNRNMVQRQKAYEETRVVAADGRDSTTFFGLITTKRAEPGKLDFYEATGPHKNPNYKTLNVFAPGGFEDKLKK